jgi:hypothetical protein
VYGFIQSGQYILKLRVLPIACLLLLFLSGQVVAPARPVPVEIGNLTARISPISPASIICLAQTC